MWHSRAPYQALPRSHFIGLFWVAETDKMDLTLRQQDATLCVTTERRRCFPGRPSFVIIRLFLTGTQPTHMLLIQNGDAMMDAFHKPTTNFRNPFRA